MEKGNRIHTIFSGDVISLTERKWNAGTQEGGHSDVVLRNVRVFFLSISERSRMRIYLTYEVNVSPFAFATLSNTTYDSQFFFLASHTRISK